MTNHAKVVRSSSLSDSRPQYKTPCTKSAEEPLFWKPIGGPDGAPKHSPGAAMLARLASSQCVEADERRLGAHAGVGC